MTSSSRRAPPPNGDRERERDRGEEGARDEGDGDLEPRRRGGERGRGPCWGRGMPFNKIASSASQPACLWRNTREKKTHLASHGGYVRVAVLEAFFIIRSLKLNGEASEMTEYRKDERQTQNRSKSGKPPQLTAR